MAFTAFIYWKQPGKDEIFTIENPVVKSIQSPQLTVEGFLLFPYSKGSKGYFFEGMIKTTKEITFTEMTLKPDGSNSKENHSDYIFLVNKAIEEIRNGALKKVVFARCITENLPVDFNLKTFFDKLCNTYKNGFVYCLALKDEIWIGATPEVFLIKENDSYLTYALAGTRQINQAFTFGSKEKEEQAFVKNYIVEILNKQEAGDINVSGVSELNTGNLLHLINEIRFKTGNPSGIIDNLHPTPAVCGTPLANAVNFINENENLDRSFYSGFLGPINGVEDFSLWVNLRCAKITGNKIYYYAGAGIIKDSIAEAEKLETERKIDTLRSLL